MMRVVPPTCSVYLLIATFIASMAPSAAAEQDYAPWLVRNNFEESLALYVHVDEECPVGLPEIESMARGEFLRARLIPQTDPRLSIDVTVSCIKDVFGGVHRGYSANVWVRFATYEDPETGQRDYGRHSQRGMVGIPNDDEGTAFLFNSVKESVAKVITSYLSANLTNE